MIYLEGLCIAHVCLMKEILQFNRHYGHNCTQEENQVEQTVLAYLL